ncbi:MAG: hypothetical protein BGO01_08375 [Armatimonadetes bacterium 55-13]|nr:MAG: hypothetical protein BGO01_08375 [Armatimonadetes bacterium 55-13]
MRRFIVFAAFLASLISITAFTSQISVAGPPQANVVDAPALKGLIKDLGYEVKDLNTEAGKEKFSFDVTRPTLKIPLGAEISPSKNYVWLTANLGEKKATTKFEDLLVQNSKIQPNFFYITSSNRLMVAIAIDNRGITTGILRRIIDKLADDIVSTQSSWGA